MVKIDRQRAKRSRSGKAVRAAVVALGAIGLAGCTTWTPNFSNVTPITGPAPYSNRTPMHSALVCLRASTSATPDVRLGVADFVDGSGASLGDGDVNGRYFSQRPDLMMIVALAKTGVRLVNRTSTAVAEWEMRQAMDRRLGEGKPVVVGQTRFDYRPVRAGEFLGSTYYVNGAITEINWSVSSNVEEAGFLGATAGRRTYRVSIAIDMVVTNSLTTEVVFARSYSKQLVGYESGAGVFRFVEASIMPKSRVELFQANIGQKQNEPVQAALRWLVELAGYETVSALSGGDARCDALVPGQGGDEVEDDDAAPSGPPVQARATVPAERGMQAVRPAGGRPPLLAVQQAPAPVAEPVSSAPMTPPQPPVTPVARSRAVPIPEYGRPPAFAPARGARPASASARATGDGAVAADSMPVQAVPEARSVADRDGHRLAPPAAVSAASAPMAPPPAPQAALARSRAVAMSAAAGPSSAVPAWLVRTADPRARAIEEEAVAAYTLAAPDAQAGADRDSHALPPPAPEHRGIDRSEEPQPIQPRQPSGQRALLASFLMWLSQSAAPPTRNDWAHANLAPPAASSSDE
jgi:curli production assembly/transport component CsgG/holdfast attachment protein HfaB